jgi:hypothetical protein
VRVDMSQVVVTQMVAEKSAGGEGAYSRVKFQVQASILRMGTTADPPSLVEMRRIDSSIHWCMDCEAGVDPFQTIDELLMVEKLVQLGQVEPCVKCEMAFVDLKQSGKMMSRPTLLISMAVIAAASSSYHSPLRWFASNLAVYVRWSLHRANCSRVAVEGGCKVVEDAGGIGRMG